MYAGKRREGTTIKNNIRTTEFNICYDVYDAKTMRALTICDQVLMARYKWPAALTWLIL